MSFFSRSLHDKIPHVVGLDSVFSQLPAPFTSSNMDSINKMVAKQFSGDQIGCSAYLCLPAGKA